MIKTFLYDPSHIYLIDTCKNAGCKLKEKKKKMELSSMTLVISYFLKDTLPRKSCTRCKKKKGILTNVDLIIIINFRAPKR